MDKKTPYIVFPRKYRPLTFDEVVGQDYIIRTLSNAVRDSKAGHSYLFSGPRGVGKTTVARIFARALNCENRGSYNPCNECANCVSVLENNSVDVLEIDGASNNGVDEIRHLRENIALAPMYGKYRVFIIDEVHMLSKGAFNALLKTLEEPPSHVVFVFATTEPHQLPTTVISRCQHFVFRCIPSSVIESVLRKICDSEGITCDESALNIITRLASGSLRDAEGLLEQAMSFTGGVVTKENISEVFHLVDKHLVEELISALVFRDPAKAFRVINTITTIGYDIKEVCDELIMVFRCILLVQFVESDAQKLGLTADELVYCREMASSLSIQEIQWILDELCAVQERLKGFFYPPLLLERAAARITQMIGVISFEEIYNRLNTLSASLKSGAGHLTKGIDIDKGGGVEGVFPGVSAISSRDEMDSAISNNGSPEIAEHNVVKKAIEVFGGKIVYPSC